MVMLNRVFLFLAAIGIVFIVSAFMLWDTVYCVVKGADQSLANGFYSAQNGVYLKLGNTVSYFLPDVFSIYAIHRDRSSGVDMALTKHMWIIEQLGELLYVNLPSGADANKYIYNPPATGWGWGNDVEKIPPRGIAPEVSYCKGSLLDSPTSQPPRASQTGSFQELLQSPVTTLLLAAILGYAYHLWSNRVEATSVAYSYDTLVSKGEYWRAITATFTHFEAFHLLFNTMSLYQLGFLEQVYGSAEYAYLSAALVFLTIGICLLMDYVRITYHNNPNAAFERAVGYSCVLFAWMVAASVRMNKFCPIFLFPSFCFDTYSVPFVRLPVNVGPIILLVATKLVIPSSSFLGHLSGIIIGYPLAWNWLDWMTPPLFTAMMLAAFMALRGRWAWQFPGYEQTANLSDFVPPQSLALFNASSRLMWVAVAAVPAVGCLFGPAAAATRAVWAFILWSAVQCKRCAHITDLQEVVENTVSNLILVLLMTAILALTDAATLGAYASSWALVVTYSPTYAAAVSACVCTAVLVLVELAICYTALAMCHEIPSAVAILQPVGLGKGAFDFLTALRQRFTALTAEGPFAGRAHRLDGGSAEVEFSPLRTLPPSGDSKTIVL